MSGTTDVSAETSVRKSRLSAAPPRRRTPPAPARASSSSRRPAATAAARTRVRPRCGTSCAS
ncbi:MAG: hypothetical protein ACK56I_30145, partial [bacterium]